MNTRIYVYADATLNFRNPAVIGLPGLGVTDISCRCRDLSRQTECARVITRDYADFNALREARRDNAR